MNTNSSKLVSDLEVSCVQMFEMYCKNLPLSKDLDPQESMHGEELLSMICNILVQVCCIKLYVFLFCIAHW